MNNYIVLLRGINVGGHNRLPMANLRALLTDNGYANVSTYIQSGNIILSSTNNPFAISTHIEQLLKEQFNYNIPVVSISIKDLELCFQENPYLTKEEDIKFLHVMFLNNIPEENTINNLDISTYENDEFLIKGKFIYLHTPDGFSKTKFTNTQFEKQLNTRVTTRNWNTVTKLVELSKQK